MTNGAFKQSWTIPQQGQTIAGKYLVDGVCGRGELAVVLSATHAGLAQRVSIKTLLPEWAGDPDIIERFERDGRAATQIKSEHAVRVLGVGTLETGAPYLVLEYLEGNNLDDVLALWGPLPVATAVDWILQAAEAIAEAHANGVAHRDLKPANLFLTSRPDGSACIKVIDFGLSKLSGPSVLGASTRPARPTDVIGSLQHMAPEQLRGAEADARADIWALGSVLHELLTGRPPFRGDTMPELWAAILTQPPPRLSSLGGGIRPEVERAVLRCLVKEPRARFSDVGQFARAIVSFGTDSARQSCARIERVLASTERTRDSMSLPPLPPETYGRMSWPDTDPADEPLPPDKSASAKIVFGSVPILGGAAVAAFLGMYSCVHGDERHDATTQQVAGIGVADHQPTATVGMANPPHAQALAETPHPPAAPTVQTPNAAAPAPKGAAPSQTAPPHVVHSEPAKLRRYTVEPDPVPSPGMRYRDDTASSASAAASPATAATGAPAPNPSSPAPATTPDDLFDTRK